MISIFDMTSGENTYSNALDGESTVHPSLFDEHEFNTDIRLEPVNSYWSETSRKKTLAIFSSLPIEMLMDQEG